MRWQTQEQYLRNLIAQKLGIPMLGKIFFAVPQGSSTSLFEEWARTEMDIPAELLFAGSQAPAQAFEACSANRNDVVLVFPGGYDLTAELAWSKNNTHLVGMAGPVTNAYYTDAGICAIYTDAIDVVDVLDITGGRCQFHDVLIANCGNNAGNLNGVNLDGVGAYFKNVTIQGAKNATNAVILTAASLTIDTGGDAPVFEDCVFGDNNGTARSTAEHTGTVRFVNGGYQANGIFRRSRFLVKGEGTNYYHAVVLPGNGSMHSQWLFENCDFHNYSANMAGEGGFVFWDACMTTHSILLRACSSQGFDEWQHGDVGDGHFGITMPDSYIGGGLAINPTAST